MPALLDLPQVWTFEDLYRLPDDGRWCEIVDGGLVMSPAPGMYHEYVSVQLRAVLAGQVPAGHWLAGPVNLDLHPSYRIPDLAVVPLRLVRRGRVLLAPSETLLVVEVVSPGSRTTDRVTKPAEYAAAGIPGYWRVETEPSVALTAYALEPGEHAYTELGTWGGGQRAELSAPFPVRIPIDELIPQS